MSSQIIPISKVDMYKDIKEQAIEFHQFQIEDHRYNLLYKNNKYVNTRFDIMNKRLNIHSIFRIFVNIHFEYPEISLILRNLI